MPPPDHQDLAVGQQGGGMGTPGRGERTGGGPGSRGRVVELGAVSRGGAVIAARHQDLAVGQQGGGMLPAGRGEGTINIGPGIHRPGGQRQGQAYHCS